MSSETAARPEPEDDLDHALEEALLCLGRAEEEHQRLLREARLQVDELHRAATRARATALETRHRALALAEEEAASVLRAAREEASYTRAQSEKELQATAHSFLAGVRKTREDTLAAANSEAERLRNEAEAERDGIIQAAYHEASRILAESREQARDIRSEPAEVAPPRGLHAHGVADPLCAGSTSEASAGRREATTLTSTALTSSADLGVEGTADPTQDEMRALMARMGQLLDVFVEATSAAHEASPGNTGVSEGEDLEAMAPGSRTEGSVPFIGSRGQHRSCPSAPPDHGGDGSPPAEALEESGSRRANGPRGIRPITRRGWRPRDE